jgi:transcriptional antiterminator RfaH
MRDLIAGWYVIYCRPRQERKVIGQLVEKNVEYCCPSVKSVRQWHDRKKVIDSPLFPSYIFVNLKTVSDFSACVCMEGFLYFVKFGNILARVRDNVIANIKMLILGGEAVEVTGEVFQPGDKLLINHGPLAGLECEMVFCRGKRRIMIRVQLLNRCLVADLPVNAVRRVV